MFRKSSVVFLGLVTFAVLAVAQENPQINAILDRMEKTQRQVNSQAYTVIREYRFYGGTEDAPKSEVTASISFIPPREKSFAIEQSQGANRGTKIVERILETEVETAKRDSATLNRSHYHFDLMGEDIVDGHHCWVLRMKPKRREKELFDGRAWLDQKSYRIRRIDGYMSKLPSWWLKDVHVTVNFDLAAGVWLQTQTRAVADVRIFGKHILTGDAVKVRTAEATASLYPRIAETSPLGSGIRPGEADRGNNARPSSAAPVIGADVFITK